MTWQTVLIFVPACFAINMAFGPNNLLSVTISAQHGMKTAVIAAIGRLIAFPIMVFATALGMGALLTASELMFSIVKWAGAAYLVWIGARLLLSKAQINLDGDLNLQKRSLPALFRQEFLVAIGNPKAILVFTAFFPQFVDPDKYWQSYAFLGGTFVAFEFISICAYSLAGSRIKSFVRTERALRWVNGISGGTMVAFGIALAATRRPT